MSPPSLHVVVEIEGTPRLYIVAQTWEEEQALRRWLELGFARRDVDDALEEIEEAA